MPFRQVRVSSAHSTFSPAFGVVAPISSTMAAQRLVDEIMRVHTPE
jgi:hypothetical protein